MAFVHMVAHRRILRLVVRSPGSAMPREPAYADERSQDGEATSASE